MKKQTKKERVAAVQKIFINFQESLARMGWGYGEESGEGIVCMINYGNDSGGFLMVGYDLAIADVIAENIVNNEEFARLAELGAGAALISKIGAIEGNTDIRKGELKA